MSQPNNRESPAPPTEVKPGAQPARQKAAPSPPPDHQGFVEARTSGLRAVRENIARRRKNP